MMERGELEDVGIAATLVGIDRLLQTVAHGITTGELSPLSEFLLGEIIADRVAVRSPQHADALPPSVVEVLDRRPTKSLGSVARGPR